MHNSCNYKQKECSDTLIHLSEAPFCNIPAESLAQDCLTWHLPHQDVLGKSFFHLDTQTIGCQVSTYTS